MSFMHLFRKYKRKTIYILFEIIQVIFKIFIISLFILYLKYQ